MAFSYFPATYQPYQQAYYQPYQNYQQTQQQPQSTIIWVSGDKEASMYPVAPNNAVALWSQTEPIVYLKQADASGKPTMKIYDLVERTTAPAGSSQAADGKTHDYATKDDLSGVLGAVKGFDGLVGGLKQEINGLKADIETIKGDMYGIAGKKKIVKKPEAAEDE